MHQSPLQKLRALPERQKNFIAIALAALIAGGVGFAQLSMEFGAQDERTIAAAEAPSIWSSLGKIIDESGRSLSAQVSAVSELNESASSALKIMTGDKVTDGKDSGAPSPARTQVIKKSVDVTQ